MAWVSVFDVGECTVKVMGPPSWDVGAELFSQVMGKGDTGSFTMTDSESVSHTLDVDVDASGAVSLSCDDYLVTATDGAAELVIRVIPTTPIAVGAQVRIRDITDDGDTGTAGVTGGEFSVVYPFAGDESSEIELFFGAPTTPDPAVLTAGTSAELAVDIYGGG